MKIAPFLFSEFFPIGKIAGRISNTKGYTDFEEVVTA
jgi:hypothetical protein